MKTQRGTFLEREVVLSSAFGSLSKAAIRIYLALRLRAVKANRASKRARRADYHYVNNGELVFTYDEIQEELEIKSRSTIAAAWTQLVEVGLVDITKTGQGIHKRESHYAISERWQRWDADPKLRKLRGFEEKARPKSDKNPGFKSSLSEFSQVQ